MILITTDKGAERAKANKIILKEKIMDGAHKKLSVMVIA